MIPALQIVEYLVSRGFELGVIVTPAWRPAVEQRGASWFPSLGLLESEQRLASLYPEVVLDKTGTPRQRILKTAQLFSIEALPSSLESIRSALMITRQSRPGREIILLCDYLSPGILPIRLGAPVPGFENESVKSILINVIPPAWTSPQNPPPWSGMEFDDSEAGRARNEVVSSSWPPEYIRADLQKMLRRCGVGEDCDTFLQPYQGDGAHHSIFENWFVCHNTTLQMCSPSLEYPTTTWPAHCKLAGFLPIKPLPKDMVFPDWFEEVRSNGYPRQAHMSPGSTCSSSPQPEHSTRKKIVVVAQGTVVKDHGFLVNPTIEALAHRDDILVAVILCQRGAELTSIPPNVRVVDHLPYDALLPYADLFVSSSGYGGLTHAVCNGVPVVQVGDTEDKMDIGRRIEYARLGKYVRPVTVDSLRQAVDAVLTDNAYRVRASQLKDESDVMGSLGIIEREILALST